MKMQLLANAKINLALDVTARRPDGYHDLRMIMQTVGLADVLTLERTAEPGIVLHTDMKGLPTDSRNHAVRAAELLFAAHGIEGGLSITLEKHIPAAAGLAGGSADAAAVLNGLNELCSLGLTQEALMETGVQIGADVPYCILGGTALAEGIGEVLTPLPDLPDVTILLATPDVAVPTGAVYGALAPADELTHPDVDGMIGAIRDSSLKGVASRLANVLETVTIPMHPVIDVIKREMRGAGAMQALMSGSGPTVFGLFEEEETAQRAQARLREKELANTIVMTRPTRARRGEND